MEDEDKQRIVQLVNIIFFLSVYYGWKPIGKYLNKTYPTSNAIKIIFSEKVKRRYFYLSLLIGIIIYVILVNSGADIGLLFSIVFGFLVVIIYVSIRGKELFEYEEYEEIMERIEICKDCKIDYVMTEQNVEQGYFVCNR